jgi:hypothetical protein
VVISRLRFFIKIQILEFHYPKIFASDVPSSVPCSESKSAGSVIGI